MYTAADLRKGLKVEIDGVPYVITEFNFTKPGKGAAIYSCKLKNMITGSTMNRQFRSNDTVGKPNLEERSLTYSFAEGGAYVFLDENYEQVTISAEALGDMRLLLVEETQVEVLFFNHQPIGVELPTFIEKKIVEAEPAVRGNTATNVLKPAKVAGGYEVQVPLFVNQGDVIRIDTRTGEYVERVR